MSNSRTTSRAEPVISRQFSVISIQSSVAPSPESLVPSPQLFPDQGFEHVHRLALDVVPVPDLEREQQPEPIAVIDAAGDVLVDQPAHLVAPEDPVVDQPARFGNLFD